MKNIILILLLCHSVISLNVMNMIDGIIVNINSYIDIENYNTADYLSISNNDLNQTLSVDIVNSILIFIII
jgi:hypothetical protein